MSLRCLIVDDEPVARDILRDYIAEVDFLELAGEVENPVKATPLLHSHAFDLMFLDINMPKLSGIEFLRLSKSLPPTIMTTAYSEYALDGYELDVLDYLTKPFSFERFLKAVHKAKDYYQRTRSANLQLEANYFFVKSDGRIDKVIYDDLICVEAMQNYVVLHTMTGKRIAYLTLKLMEDQLPKSDFVKIHKSTIVNMNKIKSITGKVLDLGSMQSTISQNLYDDVMKEIMKDRLLKR